jgi:ubiquitin-like-conjugating enzyme ATG10
LTELINTTLFHPFDRTDATSFALSLEGSSFPLLSQGDHPTLGTPCWYLHPCQTAASVGEIMKEVESQEWTEDQRLLRWMEAWFMVLGSIVDLRR